MFSKTWQFSQLARRVVLVANVQCVGKANFTVTEAEEAMFFSKLLFLTFEFC